VKKRKRKEDNEEKEKERVDFVLEKAWLVDIGGRVG
jgi:hypothetical protein